MTREVSAGVETRGSWEKESRRQGICDITPPIGGWAPWRPHAGAGRGAADITAGLETWAATAGLETWAAIAGQCPWAAIAGLEPWLALATPKPHPGVPHPQERMHGLEWARGRRSMELARRRLERLARRRLERRSMEMLARRRLERRRLERLARRRLERAWPLSSSSALWTQRKYVGPTGHRGTFHWRGMWRKTEADELARPPVFLGGLDKIST
ncbi:hypothetical protein DPX16_17893 [Anabarilius grahami]|uniref:Uncharacterized protein n=1 Tax=Anabarilius grahami TaxID=495550 RepID=A0A3N0YGA7_ANAGA|nr:hypothetical protein DPX16_17893 [Anabarilius grahami]